MSRCFSFIISTAARCSLVCGWGHCPTMDGGARLRHDPLAVLLHTVRALDDDEVIWMVHSQAPHRALEWKRLDVLCAQREPPGTR